MLAVAVQDSQEVKVNHSSHGFSSFAVVEQNVLLSLSTNSLENARESPVREGNHPIQQ